MTQRLTLALIFAAALAAAPALAQQNAPAASTTAPATPAGAVPATASTPTTVASAAATVSGAGDAVMPQTTRPAAAPTAQSMTVPTPAASSTGGLLQSTFALVFVLALVLGAAWFVKRFGPRNFGGGNSNIKLVGTLSLGARERIVVVEVGEQWIVVGASPGRLNALASMPRQAGADTSDAPAAGANFADWIKQTIDKRQGNDHGK